ncbi:MAG: glycosyltransferase family 4 protein [Phycisphaeraceae bacterium]
MKTLYLVCREGLSAVFPSMVLAPIAALQRRGVEVELAVLSPVGQLMRGSGRERWQRLTEEAREHYGVTMTLLPSAPTRARWLWSDLRVVRRWVARRCGDGAEPLVLHCRGPYAASMGLALKEWFPQLRVIFDMRGITFAENLLVRGLPDADELEQSLDAETQAIYDMEMRVATEADGVICVATSVAEWLQPRCEVDAGTLRVVLNPVDAAQFKADAAHRDAVRKQIGAAGRFVVCYCGSLREWQQHERGVELFVMLQREMPDAFFLGVTTSPDQMRASLRAAGVAERDFAVVQVPYHEVGRYLAAADLGLITRGLGRPPRLEDRLSCPVKFAEYLAAGTPVVLGPEIGDCSRIATEEGVGLVLSPHEAEPQQVLAAYAQRVADDRQAIADTCRQVAHRHHDLEQVAERISDLYRVLARQAARKTFRTLDGCAAEGN